LCHEVALEFFATKAPDPPHWSLNSCFGEIRNISVHLEPFGCLTKLNAKRAELVQKFVPRSCTGFFRIESTRSTPLDLKLMFWRVSYHFVHLGPFGCLTKLGAKRAKLVQYFMPRSRIEIFCNESTRSTPLDIKLIFWCISYRLGAFATIRLPYKTRGKTFRTGAKVRATKTHWSFSRRTHPIHPTRP